MENHNVPDNNFMIGKCRQQFNYDMFQAQFVMLIHTINKISHIFGDKSIVV